MPLFSGGRISCPSPRGNGRACKVKVFGTAGRSATRDSVAPLLLDFMSFGDKTHLLRAMPLSAMLECGAKILSTSHRQPTSYNLSTPVCAIDAFVSHTWRGGRWSKLAVLCWHYNLGFALIVCAISQVVVLGLAIGDVFPTFDAEGALHRDRLYPRTWGSDVTAVPVFLCTLLLGGSLRRRLGLRDPMVFLDKTCIDQQNKEMQSQGVKKLGAFLAHSRHMLVLYSHVYLTRLWTVYEIACFLALHPASHMSLVPTILPLTTLVGLLLTFFVRTLGTFLVVAAGFHHFAQQVCFFLTAPLLAAVFRFLAREQEAMHTQLSTFAIRHCICTCEEDREVVYSNISELMRTTGVVGSGSSQGAALDAFDVIVRSELPEVLETALNCYGKKYLLFAMWAMSSFAPPWIGKMVGLCCGLPLSTALADTSLTLVFTFACAPLNFLALERLAKLRLDMHGPCEWMIVILSGWLSVALGAIVWELLMLCWLNSKYPQTGELDRGAGLTVALMASLCFLCSWMFGALGFMRSCLQWRCTKRGLQNVPTCTTQDMPTRTTPTSEQSTSEEAAVSQWRVSL